MAGRIELLLPGLFDLPAAEISAPLEARLPALNRWLRLARARATRAFTVDAMLRHALAIDGERSEGLPLAQALEQAAGRRPERLLLLEAVHLRPDLHSAVLVPIEKTESNLSDFSIIINDLKDVFKVDFYLTAVADGIYLLELLGFDAPRHYPHPLSVLGRNLSPYVEQSRGQLDWYKLLNEMQMFMHQHEVNRQRMHDGLLPINSLWAWGSGARPRHRAGSSVFYCDDPLLRRFAESLGLPTAGLGEIAALEAGSDAVVIDLRLLRLLKSGAAGDIEALLLEIEGSLFEPLLRLRSRGRRQLRLRAGYDFDFELGLLAGLKFWCRPRGLAGWIAEA